MLLAGLATIFYFWSEEDNAKQPDPWFPLPLPIKDISGDDTISGKDPGSFPGKSIVDMFYSTTVKAKKIDVVDIRNGNRANVKTIKDWCNQFPCIAGGKRV